MIDACEHHVSHNEHASKRIKKKQMNRFVKFGGAMAREIYGYIVDDGVKTYDGWRMDPAATPIILEAARRLRTTLNCSAVADWLNAEGIPLGPYCRNNEWNGAMVRRFFKNSLLKGQPGRGFKHRIKHNETGQRISVKNPNGANFYSCPHLAHVKAEEFDELCELLNAKKTRPTKRTNTNQAAKSAGTALTRRAALANCFRR